jgi:hypothetical protein
MSSSRQEDYLIRQARIVAEMLARILGLRTGGRTEEARAGLENAYGLLLGPQGDLLRRVDSPTAAALLASPDAILALARLTLEEAEQATDPGRAEALRRRALELGLEAAKRDSASEEARSFLLALREERR